MRKSTAIISAWLLVASGTPCAVLAQTVPKPAVNATLKGDAVHPAHARHWVETRLYFGLGPADAAEKGESEARWREFLDSEVTPRFPAGLSVVDVYGQWLGSDEATPERIRSKELIIDHPATVENDAKIDAIRAAWKKWTGDRSVMKVTQRVEVSF